MDVVVHFVLLSLFRVAETIESRVAETVEDCNRLADRPPFVDKLGPWVRRRFNYYSNMPVLLFARGTGVAVR